MARNRGLGAEEDAVRVDRHDPPPGLQRDVGDGLGPRGPGVVEEDVEVPVLRLDALHRLLPGGLVGHVEGGGTAPYLPPQRWSRRRARPRPSSRPVTSTAAPSSAMRTAAAAPSPLVAPVTIATLPASLAIARLIPRTGIAYVAPCIANRDTIERLYPAGTACVAKGRTPMADGNGGLRGNAYRSDRNLQALLGRSAPWLGEDDAERLSSFGGWVASAVDEQADYTNRFAPPASRNAGRGRPPALGRPPQPALCRGQSRGLRARHRRPQLRARAPAPTRSPSRWATCSPSPTSRSTAR